MDFFEKIISPFNNRELAIFCWGIVILTGLSIFKRDIAKSLSKLLISFARFFLIRGIFLSFLFMTLYMLSFLLFFKHLNIWDKTLLKDTIYWTVGIAIILFFNNHQATNRDEYFKKIIVKNVSLILVIEFISNLYVFSFTLELITLPVLFFLGIFSALNYSDKDSILLKKISDKIIQVYGIIVLIFTIVQITKNFNDFATTGNLKSMLLGPTLTLIYIPFLYLNAIYMKYEEFFSRVNYIFKENRHLRRFTKWLVLKKCNLNIRKLRLAKKLRIYTSIDKSKIIENFELIINKEKPVGNKLYMAGGVLAV